MQKATCLWFAAHTPHSMNCLELSLSESACFHQLNCMHATIYGPGVVMTTASYLDWTVLQSGGSLWFVSWSHVTHSHAILLGCVIQIIEWIDLLHVHVTWSIAGRDENGLQSLLIQWCGYITVIWDAFLYLGGSGSLIVHAFYSVFFMLVWIDTIVWSGLDAESSMSVGCCTHTMLFYVNRLGLTLWKCLLPLAELGTCLNMQIEFTHLLHSVPLPHTHCTLSVSTTHMAHFQFQPHTHTSQSSTCSISLFTAKALAQGAFSWSTHCSFSNMLSIL